jgi:dihydroxyacetone kinase-like predicted kinase
MLSVLKQAGVVDAGGQGFLTIISGWIAALEGQTPAIKEKAPRESEIAPVSTGITALEALEYPYCTEFLVKGMPSNGNHQKGACERRDCLLVVGTDES